MATVQRSPKYPFISLDKALNRARQLHQAEGRNKAPVAVAVKAWGYAPTSSGGQQTIGALIGYGLLLDEGSGDARSLKLTELALRILLDNRPDSIERDGFVREAALKPKIFLDLYARWKESGLPSRANMVHTLIWDYKFPDEDAARAFIKVFTQTADFARIFAQDQDDSPLAIDTNNTDYTQPSVAKTPQVDRTTPSVAPQRHAIPEPQGGHVKQDTFSLDEGLVVVQWPANLSKESFDDLVDYFALLQRKIRRTVEAQSASKEDDSSDLV